MTPAETLAIAAYYVLLTILVSYGAHRLLLTYRYWQAQRSPALLPAVAASDAELPTVTIQLPMFNERYVAERVIRAVAAMDYPTDRLQIQVLDDSTDDSKDIARAVVDALAAQGHDIVYVHRTNRSGYKAGALDAGLRSATGELVAIFDADFVPPRSYLRDVVPHFDAANIGMVQARWDHLNRNQSLLTQAQAVLLDGHFVVEQTARHHAGLCFNFNGTAGIWRRKAIDDAGGWQHDTLTEDLDLSYRAYIAGWRFHYLTDLAIPAELPADIQGFRSQQHRWAKGGIECLRKLIGPIRRGDIAASAKAEGLIHLSANLTYPLLVALALLMPVVALIRSRVGLGLTLPLDLPLFALGFISLGLFYVSAQRRVGISWVRSLLMLPVILAVDIGLSVHKSRAVFEALVGHKTGFVRTPKHAARASGLRDSTYFRVRARAGLAESLVASWLAVGVVFALNAPTPGWTSLPFLLLFFSGYAYIGGLALAQSFPTALPNVSKLALEDAFDDASPTRPSA